MHQDHVESARKGDRKAMRELFYHYRRELLAYFYPRAKKDAADLAQTTLLCTLGQLDRYRGEAPFRHYVYAVARRILFSYKRYERQQCRDASMAYLELHLEAACDDLHTQHDLGRLGASLDQAVQRLPPHYRVVVAAHLRGLGNFDISKELNIEYHTVRSRLSRGLSRIRREIISDLKLVDLG